MIRYIKIFSLSVLCLCMACKDDSFSFTPVEITGNRIPVENSVEGDPAIEAFIEPYKDHLDETLDSTLAYNPSFLSKDDGELNTPLGNLMADIVMEQVNPVFNDRTGNNIDVVLLNHGGIRATVGEGKVTARTAYALMPFENEIVVAELAGEKVLDMLEYLEQAKTAHPVSGIQIKMNPDYEITEATIDGKEIDTTETYFIATSDYLQQGGDNMSFFNDPVELYETDYKLRNAIIDHFEKVDTLKTGADNRFIIE